ncbi:MAG: ABC transporter ATP-binding protein [bacterium]|nr:ABC transporter ATP-binding protein [bacterium]
MSASLPDLGARETGLGEDPFDSNRETFSVLGRAVRYMSPFRARFAVKMLLTLLTFLPMLALPYPVKILLDHVIDDIPIRDALGSYPVFIRPLVAAMVDASPDQILFWTLAAQVFLLLTIGMLGSDGGERDRAEGYVASGHDQATATENAANAGFSFSGGLLGLFDFRWTLRLTQDLNQYYRTSLFERIQKLPLPVFEDEQIGDAIYRLMYDTPAITSVCYRILLIPTLVPIAMALWVLTIWHTLHQPWLALYGLSFLPLVLLITFPFAALMRRQGTRSRRAGSTTTSALEEGMANIVAVQSLGGEERERSRFDRDSEDSFRQHRGVVGIALITTFATLIPGLWLLREVFLHTSDLVISGAISIGDFTVLLTYFAQLAVFAGMLGSFWFALQSSAPGLARVFFLMDLPPEQDRPGAHTLDAIREGVRMEEIDFTYKDGTHALSNISFEARVGQITALAGPAGAGKTTLAYLIPRFLEATSGRVSIDGTDIADLTHEWLRSQVAFVFQENSLFDGTIEQNIRLGKPTATPLEVSRAAQIAGADDFIRDLPEGYATQLGSAGARLSVGQKQRLGIARALVRQAPILILDEPTSALDPETEQRLVEALREATRDRIVIVIAHRLSTIRGADQILFLREGRIIERGSHEELIQIPEGAYRRFAELQGGGRESDSGGS